LIGGLDTGSEARLANSDYSIGAAINDVPGLGGSYNGNAGGLWIGSRISSNTSYLFGRSTLQVRSENSTFVPNTYTLLDAVMKNGSPAFLCNARLRGAWIGGGLTVSEMSALMSIWDEYEGILGRRAP
jgi:hypothetical protein